MSIVVTYIILKDIRNLSTCYCYFITDIFFWWMVIIFSYHRSCSIMSSSCIENWSLLAQSCWNSGCIFVNNVFAKTIRDVCTFWWIEAFCCIFKVLRMERETVYRQRNPCIIIRLKGASRKSKKNSICWFWLMCAGAKKSGAIFPFFRAALLVSKF